MDIILSQADGWCQATAGAQFGRLGVIGPTPAAEVYMTFPIGQEQEFYCTIFDILNTRPPSVDPRTSFAIQIKSNARKITAHNKVQSLFHLEIPYFIGVVKLATAELKIYSGEWFPMMTAKFGAPEKLWLRLVEKCDLLKLASRYAIHMKRTNLVLDESGCW